MKSPIIYRLKTKDINIIKTNIRFYKSLGINVLSIELFDKVNEEIIEEVLRLNKKLLTIGIRLIVKINLVELGNNLLDQKVKITDWKNPQIRKACFQFINYLIRHGIKGFDFGDIIDLTYNKKDYKQLFVYVRELSKNTFYDDREILTIANIDTSNTDIISSLSSVKYNTFSAIINNNMNIDRNFYNDKTILSALIMKLEKENSYPGNVEDKNLGKYLNYENYPYYSKTLLIMSSYFLRGIPIIEEESFDKELLDYYKEIIDEIKKYDALNSGSFSDILRKDKDVFAYIRSYNKQKILCLYNFSEKEVLINLSYYYIKDFHDYRYLIGNYGSRKIVKNICLRAYEAVSFIKQ